MPAPSLPRLTTWHRLTLIPHSHISSSEHRLISDCKLLIVFEICRRDNQSRCPSDSPQRWEETWVGGYQLKRSYQQTAAKCLQTLLCLQVWTFSFGEKPVNCLELFSSYKCRQGQREQPYDEGLNGKEEQWARRTSIDRRSEVSLKIFAAAKRFKEEDFKSQNSGLEKPQWMTGFVLLHTWHENDSLVTVWKYELHKRHACILQP